MTKLTINQLNENAKLARNRWYAYRNSDEFKFGGVAYNIIYSAKVRAEKELEAAEAKSPKTKNTKAKRQLVAA